MGQMKYMYFYFPTSPSHHMWSNEVPPPFNHLSISSIIINRIFIIITHFSIITCIVGLNRIEWCITVAETIGMGKRKTYFQRNFYGRWSIFIFFLLLSLFRLVDRQLRPHWHVHLQNDAATHIHLLHHAKRLSHWIIQIHWNTVYVGNASSKLGKTWRKNNGNTAIARTWFRIFICVCGHRTIHWQSYFR